MTSRNADGSSSAALLRRDADMEVPAASATLPTELIEQMAALGGATSWREGR